MIQPARDTALIALFELKRALRSWRALAFTTLYAVSTAGAAYLFIGLLRVFENETATQLGVPKVEYPGAMTHRLIESSSFRDLMEVMVGRPEILDDVLSQPLLAVFHLWICFALVPFFAASACTESIAGDVRTRAIRFEALRVGRLELVMGRFIGQVFLTAVASAVAMLAVWAVSLAYMYVDAPLGLGVALIWSAARGWVFGLPFVGLGLLCSQLTTSTAWARVLATVGTAGTWVAFGVARWGEGGRLWLVWDLLIGLLPQGWATGLWEPTLVSVASSTMALSALAIAAVATGFVRFYGRDL